MTTWANTWKARTELRFLLRRVRAEYRGKAKKRMVRAIHAALDALVWTPAKLPGLVAWYDASGDGRIAIGGIS